MSAYACECDGVGGALVCVSDLTCVVSQLPQLWLFTRIHAHSARTLLEHATNIFEPIITFTDYMHIERQKKLVIILNSRKFQIKR